MIRPPDSATVAESARHNTTPSTQPYQFSSRSVFNYVQAFSEPTVRHLTTDNTEMYREDEAIQKKRKRGDPDSKVSS